MFCQLVEKKEIPLRTGTVLGGDVHGPAESRRKEQGKDEHRLHDKDRHHGDLEEIVGIEFLFTIVVHKLL